MNPEHATDRPLVPAKSAAPAIGSTSPPVGDVRVHSPQKPGAVIRAVRLPLGLTVLLAERVRADLGVRDGQALGVAAAYAVGLADAALSVSGQIARSAADVAQRPARAAIDAVQAVLRQPMVARTTRPARGLTSAIASSAASTVARGRAVASVARAEAVEFLAIESASGLAWARGEVLPAVIDDLVADPKVRDLVVEQTQGALTDVAREMRRRSARADTRLEAGVRRIFTRERHELAP
jgi:hypothetical protein